jgi:hypothetical protein
MSGGPAARSRYPEINMSDAAYAHYVDIKALAEVEDKVHHFMRQKILEQYVQDPLGLAPEWIPHFWDVGEEHVRRFWKVFYPSLSAGLRKQRESLLAGGNGDVVDLPVGWDPEQFERLGATCRRLIMLMLQRQQATQTEIMEHLWPGSDDKDGALSVAINRANDYLQSQVAGRLGRRKGLVLWKDKGCWEITQ